MELVLREKDAPDASLLRIAETGLTRLEAGVPVQYVVGETDFMGLRICCDARALIPRPETEQLLDGLIQREDTARVQHALDVGTGTGCIALALARAFPAACISAVDASPDALALAQENLNLHPELATRITLIESDLLSEWIRPPEGLDLLVANLPYISSAEMEVLPGEVRRYEPHRALQGGEDGLDLIRRLAQQARECLAPGGRLYLEFGEQQADDLQHLLSTLGYQQVEIRQDLAGKARFAYAVNRG